MPLDDSNSFYRSLFDAAPDVLMLIDQLGMIQVANSRFEEILGMNLADGFLFQTLLHEDYRSGFEVMLTGAADGTPMPEAEVQVLPKSGKPIPMMLEVRPAGGSEGDFLLRLRDLSKIKGLEQEYRNLFESIADAVFIGDSDSGQIYQVNRQVCALTGYSHGEMIGRDFDQVHNVPWEEVRREIERAGHELSGRDMQLMTKSGGQVAVEVYIRIVPRGEDHIYIESAIDISARKALEKRMQDLREEWDVFMRHELRSPLTPILAFSQILMEDFPDIQRQEKVMKYLDAIYQGGKRLERLLDLTREVSQYEHGEIPLMLAQADMIQTVREAAFEAALGVGEGSDELKNRIHIVVADPLCELNMVHDVQKIQRAVANLVKNALEHDEGEVTIRIIDQQDQVVIGVHNWGEPISEDRLTTIFEKFNTTKRSQKGTGLGTTIAKLFVEAHGGKIRVSSSVKEGTTFAIELNKSTNHLCVVTGQD